MSEERITIECLLVRMIIDTTTLTFSSLLLHLQWVWRQKFLLRRHPTHKDQWALDGAVKATQRGFFATAIAGHALGIARLIAATALGNLPQKLTQGPLCLQDGKNRKCQE